MVPVVEPLTLAAAERLLTASIQGGLVVCLVWVVCRRMPAIRPSLAAALWWLASLKLIVTVLPVPPVPIPLLPAGDRAAVGPAVAASGTAGAMEPERQSRLNLLVPAASMAATGAGEPAGREDRSRVASPSTTSSRWIMAAIGVWLLALMAQIVRLMFALSRLRGVVRRSRPLEGDQALVSGLARLVGLRRVPGIRVSDEIDAPQVTGTVRAIVLLPESLAASLSDDDRVMALCHELMHVRRHDLALGWVPALAERLFFFHPMARLAAREYVVAREAACDAAVVRALDVAPGDYGRLLVRLGVAGSDAVFAASGASSSIASLKRRLDMLHHLTAAGVSRRVTWSSFALLMIAALVPLRLVAREQLPPPPPATVAPAPPAAPAEPQAAPLPPAVPPPAARPAVVPAPPRPAPVVRPSRVAPRRSTILPRPFVSAPPVPPVAAIPATAPAPFVQVPPAPSRALPVPPPAASQVAPPAPQAPVVAPPAPFEPAVPAPAPAAPPETPEASLPTPRPPRPAHSVDRPAIISPIASPVRARAGAAVVGAVPAAGRAQSAGPVRVSPDQSSPSGSRAEPSDARAEVEGIRQQIADAQKAREQNRRALVEMQKRLARQQAEVRKSAKATASRVEAARASQESLKRQIQQRSSQNRVKALQLQRSAAAASDPRRQSVDAPARGLTQQLEQLSREQRSLREQQRDLEAWQKMLADAQQRLSSEAERLREAVERATAAVPSAPEK